MINTSNFIIDDCVYSFACTAARAYAHRTVRNEAKNTNFQLKSTYLQLSRSFHLHCRPPSDPPAPSAHLALSQGLVRSHYSRSCCPTRPLQPPAKQQNRTEKLTVLAPAAGIKTNRTQNTPDPKHRQQTRCRRSQHSLRLALAPISAH